MGKDRLTNREQIELITKLTWIMIQLKRTMDVAFPEISRSSKWLRRHKKINQKPTIVSITTQISFWDTSPIGYWTISGNPDFES